MHFWPPVLNSSNMASMQQSDSNAQDPEHCPSIVKSVETGSTILNHLPPIMSRGYFGPRREKPQTTASKPAKKPRPSFTEASNATERSGRVGVAETAATDTVQTSFFSMLLPATSLGGEPTNCDA